MSEEMNKIEPNENFGFVRERVRQQWENLNEQLMGTAVEVGLKALEEGRTLSHEEVKARFEHRP